MIIKRTVIGDSVIAHVEHILSKTRECSNEIGQGIRMDTFGTKSSFNRIFWIPINDDALSNVKLGKATF